MAVTFWALALLHPAVAFMAQRGGGGVPLIGSHNVRANASGTSAVSSLPPKWAKCLKEVRTLGKGAFGVATLYTVNDLTESVAVKTIVAPSGAARAARGANKAQARAQESLLSSLQQELKALEVLSRRTGHPTGHHTGHPNVLYMFASDPETQEGDLPRVNGFPVHIMTEFAAGGDLLEAIPKQVGSDPDTRREKKRNALLMVARDTLAGLARIHDTNRIHSDIKPENIFLTDDTASGCISTFTCRYLVADLGLAVSGVGPTDTTSAGGTPGYKAPEYFTDPPTVQHKSDIFALGTTLHKLICGYNLLCWTGYNERADKYGEAFIKLVEQMKSHAAADRPNATVALTQVETIIGRLVGEGKTTTFSRDEVTRKRDSISAAIRECLKQ